MVGRDSPTPRTKSTFNSKPSSAAIILFSNTVRWFSCPDIKTRTGI